MFYKLIEEEVVLLGNVNYVLSLPPAELIDLTYETGLDVENKSETCTQNLPFSASDLFHVPIQNFRKLTDGNDVKIVYEVTFDVKGTNLKFEPGDTIGIIPRNRDDEVSSLLNALKLNDIANKRYKIIAKPHLTACDLKKYNALQKIIPSVGTLEDLFLKYLNIRAVVKKLFLRSLSIYCSNEQEKKCMEVLCSKEGSELYNKYILNGNASIMDVLNAFESCTPPVFLIIQNLPKLLPRPYSVCNSALMNTNELKICFSVYEDKQGLKGVTTGWLEEILEKKSAANLENRFTKLTIAGSTSLKENVETYNIPIYLRVATSFRLPTSEETPIIMIGTGTGISPYIGFLQEKRMRKKRAPEIRPGLTCLFYGCRYQKKDFLYKEELSDFLDDGTLTMLKVSLSRDGQNRCYVQDDLKREANLVVEAIDNGGVIYVCGNLAAMERAVKKSIEKCIELVKNCTPSESEHLVTKLQVGKKYIVDVWS